MNNKTLDSFASVNGVNALMRRVGAEQLLALLRNTGFWLSDGTAGEKAMKFPTGTLSSISDGALGDQCGYWQSELSRAYGVLGAMEGALVGLKHELARAKDAAEIEEWEAAARDGVKRTASEIAARTRTNKNYQDREDRVRQVEVIVAALSRTVVALDGYTKTLSRELTRRGDLIKGRGGR